MEGGRGDAERNGFLMERGELGEKQYKPMKLRLLDRRTDTQTNKQTGKQADRQTGRQTDRQTDLPSGINFSTGFVQRVLLVVSKHIDNEGKVLEVVDERRIHRNTHLPISIREYIKLIGYV